MKITDIKETQPYIYQRLLECSREFYTEIPEKETINTLFTWSHQVEISELWSRLYNSNNIKDFSFFYNGSKSTEFKLKDKVFYTGSFKELKPIGKNGKRLVGKIINVEMAPLPIYTVKYSNGEVYRHTGHCIKLKSKYNIDIQNDDLVMVNNDIPSNNSTFYFRYPTNKVNFLATPQRVSAVYTYNGRKALGLDCGLTIPLDYVTLHRKERSKNPRKLIIKSEVVNNVVSVKIFKEILQKAQISIYLSPTANCQVASLSGAQQLCVLNEFPIDEQLEVMNTLFKLSGKRQLLFDIRDGYMDNFKKVLTNANCVSVSEQAYRSTNTSEMVLGLFKKR